MVVQNERYDDWTPTVILLKKFFIEYPQRILHYHDRHDTNPVRAWNSTAAQGNFLEVLNMALNGRKDLFKSNYKSHTKFKGIFHEDDLMLFSGGDDHENCFVGKN